jgi:hypothetical protein
MTMCADCMWCPFDRRDLPPEPALGSRLAVEIAIATFDCEPTTRRQRLDGGRACRHFQERPL